MRKRRRLLGGLLLLAAAIGFAAPRGARADDWPAHAIRLVNPLAAGSGPDILSRLVAERLSRSLGQQVVVENRPGAANVLAAQAAARAAPDGYTLFFATSLALAVNPHTFKALPYDAESDFVPIAMIGKSAFFLLANPDLPAASLPELIALAKAQPGKLSIAVDGPKNSSGMLAAWLNKRAGTDLVLVPYATMPQGIQDALAGRVPLAMAAGLAAGPLLERGAMRALAVSAEQRLPAYAQVPTMAESLPGLDFIGWFVLAAPAHTPPAVVARLNREIEQILAQGDLARRLDELGFYLDRGYTPDATAAFVRSQRETWGEIVRTIGITPE